MLLMKKEPKKCGMVIARATRGWSLLFSLLATLKIVLDFKLYPHPFPKWEKSISRVKVLQFSIPKCSILAAGYVRIGAARFEKMDSGYRSSRL